RRAEGTSTCVDRSSVVLRLGRDDGAVRPQSQQVIVQAFLERSEVFADPRSESSRGIAARIECRQVLFEFSATDHAALDGEVVSDRPRAQVGAVRGGTLQGMRREECLLASSQ